MKSAICTACGTVGTFIAAALGGWDAAIITLTVFMIIDYATGWVVAVVFKKSHKTGTGGYSSAIGWEGLCKKVMVFLLVVMAQLLDKLSGTSFVRDAVCIGFTVNEGMSILENAGLMGIPIPAPLKKALDVLNTDQEGSRNA